MAKSTRQDSQGGPQRANPAALAPEDAARLLSNVGGTRVEVADIEADLDAGAPRNSDGTINLVHYVAWLVGQVG